MYRNTRNCCHNQSINHQKQHHSGCHSDSYRSHYGCQDNFNPHHQNKDHKNHRKHHSHHVSEKSETSASKNKEIEELKSYLSTLVEEVSLLKARLNQSNENK